MPRPEWFSILELYGREDKDVFERRVREGYTEVAFGDWNCIYNQLSVRLWAFYHPDGRIVTYEHLVIGDRLSGGVTYSVTGKQFEAEYNEKELQKHLNEFQVKRLSAKSGLAEVVENWKIVKPFVAIF